MVHKNSTDNVVPTCIQLIYLLILQSKSWGCITLTCHIWSLVFLWVVIPIRNGAKVECLLNATVDCVVDEPARFARFASTDITNLHSTHCVKCVFQVILCTRQCVSRCVLMVDWGRGAGCEELAGVHRRRLQRSIQPCRSVVVTCSLPSTSVSCKVLLSRFLREWSTFRFCLIKIGCHLQSPNTLPGL